MAYVQFAAYHVSVFHVHQFLTNRGFLVYHKKQLRYQPVTYCTYLSVLGSYNNWNIIHVTPRSTNFEAFDEIHQVFLYGISDNMDSLFQSGKYTVINKSDTTTNGFFVIQFISEAYTLQK